VPGPAVHAAVWRHRTQVGKPRYGHYRQGVQSEASAAKFGSPCCGPSCACRLTRPWSLLREPAPPPECACGLLGHVLTRASKQVSTLVKHSVLVTACCPAGFRPSRFLCAARASTPAQSTPARTERDGRPPAGWRACTSPIPSTTSTPLQCGSDAWACNKCPAATLNTRRSPETSACSAGTHSQLSPNQSASF